MPSQPPGHPALPRSTWLILANRPAYFSMTRLFFTENTPDTPFAERLATVLSPSLLTTPSSVTLPFATMMWMEGTADKVYRSSPGFEKMAR